MKAQLLESDPMIIDGVYIPRLFSYRVERANGWCTFGTPDRDPYIARLVGIMFARKTYDEMTTSLLANYKESDVSPRRR